MRGLDTYTVVSGCLAILGVIGITVLEIADGRDKRKKFLGFYFRHLKKVSIYLSLIFTVITILIESNHNMNEKVEAIEKVAKEHRRQDSFQQINDQKQKVSLGVTLSAINKTLKTQQATLDSTGTVLSRQKQELAFQTKTLINTNRMLGYQNQGLKNELYILSQNNELLKGQGQELNSISNILYDTDPTSGIEVKSLFSTDQEEIHKNIRVMPHFNEKICSDVISKKIPLKILPGGSDYRIPMTIDIYGYGPVFRLGIYVYQPDLTSEQISDEFKRLGPIELNNDIYYGQTYMGTILMPILELENQGIDTCQMSFTVLYPYTDKEKGFECRVNEHILTKLKGISTGKIKVSYSNLVGKLCAVAVCYRALDLKPFSFIFTNKMKNKSLSAKPIKIVADHFYKPDIGQSYRQVIYLCEFNEEVRSQN